MLSFLFSNKTIEKGYKKEGNIKHIHRNSNGIFGEIYSSSMENIYVAKVYFNGEMCCSCKSGLCGSRRCWHICALFHMMDAYERDWYVRTALEDKRGKTMNYQDFIDVNALGVNDLIGGLPIGSAMGLVGPHASGKTILNMHFLYETLRSTNTNCGVIVDTEGSPQSFNGWANILNERYGMDLEVHYIPIKLNKGNLIVPKVPTSGIIVLSCRDIQRLLWMHGRKAFMKISNGKITMKPQDDGWEPDIRDSKMGKILSRLGSNCRFLSYDSISFPLADFGSERVNFPARGSATAWWLFSIERLAEEFNLFTTGILHESVDPGKQYDRPKIFGGKVVGHTFKFLVYISKERTRRTPKTEKRGRDDRELWNMRHPFKKPFDVYLTLGLGKKGFVLKR